MRRGLLLSVSLAALFLAGCPSKPKNGECTSTDDCKDQAGFGKICVSGRCQECGADTDCKAGFVCRSNKCAPRPECENPSDCPGGTCQDGKCVASAPKPGSCTSDAQCGPGQSCKDGMCAASTDSAAGASAIAACVGDENAVRFAFDKSDLDDAARSTLDRVAQCLKGKRAKLLVEGHCDERGTAEYNIALGGRRAEAVKKYLVNLGIDAGTVRTTSFGKEKPVCTENDEGCWARNRRGVVRADAGGGPTSSLESLERHAAR